ncbi:hypothetical protein [Bdellovibrio sp. NC01]|uniref:hypothetical protein n=1 Tax=Bdellovibrio sp. NC01 TaxID=2220073 RepID=UPI00115AD64E|nr:hypothetical protein [Bdellovibrio sp. NC01]QDK38354.1 hypothetical protein DOE51_12565 [Bdellovibrio sp. NC01]
MKQYILTSLLAVSLISSAAFAQETKTDEAAPKAEAESAAMAPESTEATSSTETAAPAENTSVTEIKPKKKVSSISSYAVGLSTLQWNEPLILKQAGQTYNDVANYSGLSISFQKEVVYYRWGWNFGGFFGTGRANGGGNVSAITYQKDKQAFTILGISPRAFWRLSGRVNVGVTGMAYMRSVDWPSDTPGLTVDTTRNFTLTALADLNLRLTDTIDFYQGIGPLDKGATFWKIGLAYRFY